MQGTHLGQGWGQGIQLPFATRDIFSEQKSNPRIRPQHSLTACIALSGLSSHGSPLPALQPHWPTLIPSCHFAPSCHRGLHMLLLLPGTLFSLFSFSSWFQVTF